MMLLACVSPTHLSHGDKYDLRYRVPSIILYIEAFIRSFLAFCGSSGSLPNRRYSRIGIIQLSSFSCVTSATSFYMIDLSCITSTKTSLASLEKDIEANLLRASAFLFWSLLMCSIEWQGKLANNSFAFSRPANSASIRPAPEPSKLEAPSVNNFHAFFGSGSFLLAFSSFAHFSSFEGVSARKSARPGWDELGNIFGVSWRHIRGQVLVFPIMDILT
ncbi:hypothetical protein Tco_0110838 [Tanacetum coccineum]